MADPEKTNKNVHARLLLTSRQVDPATRAIGAKPRVLDDRRTGALEVERLREERQKRANSALAKVGARERVELRPYETQSAAGDAPEGAVGQHHLDLRWTALSRRMMGGPGTDRSRVAPRASDEET